MSIPSVYVRAVFIRVDICRSVKLIPPSDLHDTPTFAHFALYTLFIPNTYGLNPQTYTLSHALQNEGPCTKTGQQSSELSHAIAIYLVDTSRFSMLLFFIFVSLFLLCLLHNPSHLSTLTYIFDTLFNSQQGRQFSHTPSTTKRHGLFIISLFILKIHHL